MARYRRPVLQRSICSPGELMRRVCLKKSVERRLSPTWLLRLLILPVLFLAAVAQADEKLQKILIADPYIELHTGPGRGFPIFYVAERGQEVEIVKRRTDWFMVRTSRDIEGWV